MKKTLLWMWMAAVPCLTGAAEYPSADTLTVYNPLSEEFHTDPDDENGFSRYFLPAEPDEPYASVFRRHLAGFRTVRFSPRGYEDRFSAITVNGLSVTDAVDGTVYWNLVTGVNVIGKYSSSEVSGLGANPYSPAFAGSRNISTMLPNAVGRHRFTYARTDRGYSDRLRYAGGLRLGENLSLGIGADRRWGRDSHIKGVFTDMTTVGGGLNLEKEDHRFSFVYTASFGESGLRSAAAQEVFDLAGNYYNPNWGYQNGKVRNSRVRGVRQDFGMFSYEGPAGERTTVTANLLFMKGENSYSRLSWYDAPTPSPDYYRSMPGFFGNTEVADAVREEWLAGNASVTQIDWAGLYEANRTRYTSDEVGYRSYYVLRDEVTKRTNAAADLRVEFRPYDRTVVSGGLEYRKEYSARFARMKDLLGGYYWVDIDQYLLDDEYYGDKLLNDLRHPDRLIFTGSTFGYHYKTYGEKWRAHASADHHAGWWRVSGGVEVAAVSYRRKGIYEKEMYPGSLSYGYSPNLRFTEYGMRADATFFPTYRQRIGLAVYNGNRAPVLRNVFLSPDYRNETVGNPAGVRITSAEIDYRWEMPSLTLTAGFYAAFFRNLTEVRNFYDDVTYEYLNLIMTGIGRSHAGAEIGLEYVPSPVLTLSGMLSFNRYVYDRDPSVRLVRDSDGAEILRESTAYLKNIRLAGTPQRAATFQVRYRFPRRWYGAVAVHHTGNHFVRINPAQRMDRILDLASSPESRQLLTRQEKLEETVTLSANLSKNFRMGKGRVVGLWASADNLLDRRNIRMSGYEQMRVSRTSTASGRLLEPFPSKYYYAYGRTFYIQASYSF